MNNKAVGGCMTEISSHPIDMNNMNKSGFKFPVSVQFILTDEVIVCLELEPREIFF
jgi:hypothetical protein